MNPVVGLDVAKGGSQVQAFLDKKKPYKSSFKVEHTIKGLETLLHFLREIEDKTGGKTSNCIRIYRTLSYTRCTVF
jgi:transposase